MCGFVEYIEKKRINLEAAAKAIFHRGPDDQNAEYKNNWAAAFNRLSIIDLSKDSMQPFEFDGVTVFLNVEFYNYIELKTK
jgi:asparagine synthetase B (glutamine-hydrolysing)